MGIVKSLQLHLQNGAWRKAECLFYGIAGELKVCTVSQTRKILAEHYDFLHAVLREIAKVD